MTSSYSPVLTSKAVKDETEERILRDAHVSHLHTDILTLYTNTPSCTCTHEHKPQKKTLCCYLWNWICEIRYDMRLSFQEFINQSLLSDWLAGHLWIAFIECLNTSLNTFIIMLSTDIWTSLQNVLNCQPVCFVLLWLMLRLCWSACYCGSVQVRDAVAVMQLLMWLEKAVPQGKETELTAAEYVNQCRRWVHT